MLKRFSIFFLSLTLVFSLTSTSFIGTAEASGPEYHPVKVSATKTVRTDPESFPADIGLALIGLGGAYKLFEIPKTLNKFLAWAGLSSTIVARNDTTTYDVTMHIYYLKKPTSTSAGYYKYKIKNNKTGQIAYTKSYNIGKNGV